MCKKHKDISDKEIKFALMKDVSVEVAEKPQIGEKNRIFDGKRT